MAGVLAGEAAAHVKGRAKQWRWRWFTLLNGGTWYPNWTSLPVSARPHIHPSAHKSSHEAPPPVERDRKRIDISNSGSPRNTQAGSRSRVMRDGNTRSFVHRAPGAADSTSCLPTSSIRAAAGQQTGDAAQENIHSQSNHTPCLGRSGVRKKL